MKSPALFLKKKKKRKKEKKDKKTCFSKFISPGCFAHNAARKSGSPKTEQKKKR